MTEQHLHKEKQNYYNTRHHKILGPRKMKLVRTSQKFNCTVTKAGWNFRELRKRISKMMKGLQAVK